MRKFITLFVTFAVVAMINVHAQEEESQNQIDNDGSDVVNTLPSDGVVLTDVSDAGGVPSPQPTDGAGTVSEADIHASGFIDIIQVGNLLKTVQSLLIELLKTLSTLS